MIAIDTNILLYVYDDRTPQKQERSMLLIASLSEGVLLWQVAVEFLAASRKLDRSPDAGERAWERLSALRRSLRLIPPTPAVLDVAQRLMATHPLQFWDALIHAACIDAGVTRLYSEDLPGEPIPQLEIVNPFQ